MKKFLLKGIFNDKGRSLLPIIVVATGTMVTVLLYSWITGIMGESIEMSSNMNTGDLKVMTRLYAEDYEQLPNDLAILNADALIAELKEMEPSVEWVKRIRFGALADFPDSLGETRGQGPVAGWAIDMLTTGTKEPHRFNLEGSVIQGSLPKSPGQCLLSEDLAKKFSIGPGDSFTLFGTTMEGGFSFRNFTVSGTVRFGAAGLDRGAVIIDISDAQSAFGMESAAGEILGYLPDTWYDDDVALSIKDKFNQKYSGDTDGFAPVMMTLKEQSGMADMVEYTNYISGLMVFIFVAAMSIVLWNGGLLGGLRRYTEFGVRLALGEDKGHIYKTLLYEALMIGTIGSILGTIIGVLIVLYLNVHGVNLSGMMKNSTLLLPSIFRPAITSTIYYIGFIPGIFSMILGNGIAGLGIYKRETARLFNELEV
ncbi:MAG: hypothetical protein A2X18_01965 [Bacteroidetes bacterium GWF2_40_14]|nr:MAG: hypothetical protein A2X18_01965 [Bacteroidetes bacterium GWF2_40_14]